MVVGVDSALEWNDSNPLFVLGGVVLGGIAGEAIGIERRLEGLGDRLQAAVSRGGESRVSEGFVTEYSGSYSGTAGFTATVTTLSDEVVGDIRPALLVLLLRREIKGGIALLLAATCVIAGMLAVTVPLPVMPVTVTV